MSLRCTIQKSQPPSFLPTHRPRDASCTVKHLPTIHKRGQLGRKIQKPNIPFLMELSGIISKKKTVLVGRRYGSNLLDLP